MENKSHGVTARCIASYATVQSTRAPRGNRTLAAWLEAKNHTIRPQVLSGMIITCFIRMCQLYYFIGSNFSLLAKPPFFIPWEQLGFFSHNFF